MRKIRKLEKLVLLVPRPLKGELLTLSDTLGISLGEYVRGILLTFIREARKKKE